MNSIGVQLRMCTLSINTYNISNNSVFLYSKTNTICKKCAQNVKQFGTVSLISVSYLFLCERGAKYLFDCDVLNGVM